MNRRTTLTSLAALPLLLLGVVSLSSCGSSSSGGDGGFNLIEASNGFGRILPHTIPVANSLGLPTNEIIEIRTLEDLTNNLTQANPILSPTEWRTQAVLPSNAPGNHFIYARFNRNLDLSSILSGAGGVSGLTGNISVVQVVDASTVEPVSGIAFIGGRTFGPGLDPDSPGDLAVRRWVSRDPMGNVVALDVDGGFPGLGFPGTETGFAGDNVLVDENTFIFVADTDGNLQTHEAFPAGNVQIQLRIGTGVLSAEGENLPFTAVASTTVGPDMVGPEVQVSGSSQTPLTIPANGDIDVDPLTNVEITFTEPIQLLTVGSLNDGKPPIVTAAIQLRFGPSTGQVDVPFYVRPFSVLDLTRLELSPIFPFPGNGPVAPGQEDLCGDFASVEIVVNTAQFQDLVGNTNTLAPLASFTTTQGPGLVNAPVLPEALYIGRRGSDAGISVVDLNGFGGTTGNPEYDVANPIAQGASNFPNNPNVALQGSVLVPPLAPGTCTFNGGSSGPLTLVRDSTLNDLLASSALESIEDMAIGQPLDLTFNDAAPFGCQAGGANICATTGLKRVLLAFGTPNTLTQSTSALATITLIGTGNLVSFGPHPNPPPIVFPPLCTSPFIAAQEPTSSLSGLLLTNLLVPGGNRFGDPAINQPPQNLLSRIQTSSFSGPSPPQSQASACLNYDVRQQIGQFLYVADRTFGEVVVFNSNNFTVLDRIRLPDPTSFAMSPNMDLLAVTNQGADSVSFINVEPTSARFHQVVRTVRVGTGPTGIAWEPGNEDIFVCNQGDSSLSILSAFSLNVRKVVRNQISSPIDVAITPRQFGFGFLRGVYYAYILNGDGRVAFFESGPAGINGIGFDDVIASFPINFTRPKAIQPTPNDPFALSVWIAHENPVGLDGVQTGQTGGAMTQIGIIGGVSGVLPLTVGQFAQPGLRDLQIGVVAALGEGPTGLSGIPVDLAFDNTSNNSALSNISSPFSAGSPLPYNGKSILKSGGAVAGIPQFLFLPIPGQGVVDVIELETGTLQRFDTNVFEPGLQSLPVRNATLVADYFRQ